VAESVALTEVTVVETVEVVVLVAEDAAVTVVETVEDVVVEDEEDLAEVPAPLEELPAKRNGFQLPSLVDWCNNASSPTWSKSIAILSLSKSSKSLISSFLPLRMT